LAIPVQSTCIMNSMCFGCMMLVWASKQCKDDSEVGDYMKLANSWFRTRNKVLSSLGVRGIRNA